MSDNNEPEREPRKVEEDPKANYEVFTMDGTIFYLDSWDPGTGTGITQITKGRVTFNTDMIIAVVEKGQ